MFENKKELEAQLWNIADDLRGKMNADEFKDYMLGFIFYKYLSHKMLNYANKILKNDNLTYFTILDLENKEEYLEAVRYEAINKLGYFLEPEELFSEFATKKGFIIEDLEKILNNLQTSTMGEESEEDFINLFEDMNLNSSKLGRTNEERNELIQKILKKLNSIDFDLDNFNRDVLGDAYEYLISKFASGAGKKAGEFYTPHQVSKVLAKIVSIVKDKLKSVYDPTCGSGSLLLTVGKEVEQVVDYYGQELNRTTYNLARMNMIMHGVHYRDFHIKQEDTLEKPQHKNLKFEAIVANPPFSAKWSAKSEFLTDERFSSYGKLAPSSKADFAFVQHMIHHLDEDGTMAVVLPHGVLFRGSAEGHIRRYLIENSNYIDAVIGLPANIFYGTSIPTAIIVLKKCREENDKIMFIDASNEFEKAKNQNFLTDANINKIIDTYQNQKVIEKYSYLASLDEIKENDFNLNIPRYVYTFEEEEPINLDEVSQDLKNLNSETLENQKIIYDFCNELNISTPF